MATVAVRTGSTLGTAVLGSALILASPVSASSVNNPHVLNLRLKAVSTPTCTTGWTSTAKVHGSLSPAPGTFQRVGRHPCFDRLVFHFRGPANGYRVQYANNVVTEGKGDIIPLKGGAKIAIHLLDPTTHVSKLSVAGFTSFRDLKYGGSFEGYSTFGLGVRARLPFRVFTLHGVGSDYMIVVDVAHHW